MIKSPMPVASVVLRLDALSFARVWNERDHKNETLNFIKDEVFGRYQREIRRGMHPLVCKNEDDRANMRRKGFLFGAGIRKIEKLNDMEGLLKLRLDILLSPHHRLSDVPYQYVRNMYCRPLADACEYWASKVQTGTPYEDWERQVYSELATAFKSIADAFGDFNELYIETKTKEEAV